MKKIVILAILFITNLSLSNLAFGATNDNDLIVTGFNEFAFNLYRKIEPENQNVVLSPFSLSSLLGILAVGAEGNTQSQFKKILNIKKIQDVHHLTTALENLNQINNKNKTLLIANALWADQRFTYKQSFLNLLQKNKSIHFATLDCFKHPEEARHTINQWVEKRTQNLIKQLLSPGSITSDTALILTNAIYFKGLWQLPFKSENTQQKSFILANKKEIQTAFMQKQDKFLYAENDFLQMLQLNYSNNSLAMAILLPKTDHSLVELNNMMNPKIFAELLSNVVSQEVNVSILKFKIESTFHTLNKNMQALGLHDAFTKKANFSNMSTDKLFISNIIQKTVIQVDEKGTTAAAASGIVIATTAYIEPVIFNANRPFLFIIFDKKSKMILFLGQVTNPQATSA